MVIGIDNMNMKKFFVCICLLCAAVSLYSFEWGGVLYNDTNFHNESGKFQLKQNDRLSFWLRVPFSQDENTYFLTEAYYDFSYEEKIVQSLDVNLFKLGMIVPLSFYTSLQFDMGRLLYEDITQYILAQPLDGLSFNFFNEDFSCTAMVGYTGLINAHNVTYVYSPASYDENSLYPTSPKFCVSSVRFALPQLFLHQDVQLEWDGIWDFSENNYQRMYASLALNGELFRNTYYILSSDFAFGLLNNTWEKGLANLTHFEFVYYPSFWDSSLTFSTLFATGKTSITRDFSSFNSLNIDYFGIHKLSNVLKNSLAFSFKPIANLYFGLETSLFTKFASKDNTSGFHGFEFGGNILWQIVSDLSLANETYAYIKFSDSSLKFATSIKVEFKF